MNTAQLSWLIEASLEELIQPDLHPELPEDLAFYRRCLIEFHKGDAAELEKLLDEAADRNLFRQDLFRVMIQLRLEILAWKANASTLERATVALADAGIWEGELMILIATAVITLDHYEQAKHWFARSAVALARIGAKRKALRAEMNVLAAISHIEPEKNLIAERFYIYRKAKALGEWQSVANTLLNLSREHQRLGAIREALKLVNRAIAACRANMATEVYYCCHAHKAHLLLQLGRESEAQTSIEIARGSSFPVVQAAVQVLDELFPGKCGSSKSGPQKADGTAVASWRERSKNKESREKALKSALSPTEEALLSFLGVKPRGKFEIYEKIFGAEVHPFVAENRLKNLLGRIRKKLPGLIICEKNLYSVTNEDKLREIGILIEESAS